MNTLSEGRRQKSKFNAVNANIQFPNRLTVQPKKANEFDEYDYSLLPKKQIKDNLGIKNLKYKNTMVNDLLANLTVSLNEKRHLVQVNDGLKESLLKLKQENNTLKTNLHENKVMYEESIKNLQAEVANNERSIIDRSKDVLMRQKRYVDNIINKLNYENQVLKSNINKMEQQYKLKLKEVESKLKQ